MKNLVVSNMMMLAWRQAFQQLVKTFFAYFDRLGCMVLFDDGDGLDCGYYSSISVPLLYLF
jgi:hypothetical protein